MIEDLVVQPRYKERMLIEGGKWSHPYRYEKVRRGQHGSPA